MKVFLIHKFTLFAGAAVMSAAGTAVAQETPSSGVNAAGQTAMEGGTVLTTGAEGLSGALTDFGERQQEIGETTAAELQAFLESQGNGDGEPPAGPEALMGELEGLDGESGDEPAAPEETLADEAGGGDDEASEEPPTPEEGVADLQDQTESGEDGAGDDGGSEEPPAPEELADAPGSGGEGDASEPGGLSAQVTVDVQPDGQADVTAGVSSLGETEAAFPPEGGDEQAPAEGDGGSEDAEPPQPGDGGDEAASDPEPALAGDGEGEGGESAPSGPESAAAELEEAGGDTGESPANGDDSGNGSEPPPEFAASGEATGDAVAGGSGALANALSGFRGALQTGFDGVAEALLDVLPALGAAFDRGAGGEPEAGAEDGAGAVQAGVEQGGEALAESGEQGQASAQAGAADGEAVLTEFMAAMQAAFGAEGDGDAAPPEGPGEPGSQPAPPEGGQGGAEPPFAVAPGVTILAGAGQATADNVSDNLIGQGGDAVIVMVEDGGAVLGEGIVAISAGLAADAAGPPEGDGGNENAGGPPAAPGEFESGLETTTGEQGSAEAPAPPQG